MVLPRKVTACFVCINGDIITKQQLVNGRYPEQVVVGKHFLVICNGFWNHFSFRSNVRKSLQPAKSMKY